MVESTVLVAAVIGFVEFLRRLQARDYFAAITILGSAIIGVLLGALDAPGVANVWQGLTLGLGASGAITALSRINTSGSVSPVAKVVR
jgi:hypothetical protein